MFVAQILAFLLTLRRLQTLCASLWFIASIDYLCCQPTQFNFPILTVLRKSQQRCGNSVHSCLPAGHLVSRSVDKVILHLEKFPLDVLCDAVGFADHMNELVCKRLQNPQQVCT